MLRASEKAMIEAVLGRRPGVERVEANPVAQTATVTYDPARTSVAELRRWIQECGLHCAGQSVPEHICDPLMEPDPPNGHGHHHTAAAGTRPPPVQPNHHHPEPAADGHAAHAEQAARSPHEVIGHGEVFYEAASVLAAFVLLGHWFEMRARCGANDAIRSLLDLAPPKALVLRNGEPVEVPTAEVQVGDLLLVRPGAKIATDGVVEDGDSEVDESVVTGESLPVHKQPGSQVIGATINRNGTLRVRATKVGADTALAQIVQLVQEAQNSKAPGQKLADRAAFWLVLVALIGGGATSLAWFLARGDVTQALLFAITVVVITCPHALGLATPTAIMVGTGLGARRGILFKNALALETAARIDTVVMDKTGTLTKGDPEVVALATADGVSEPELLRLVAGAEAESEHPLAK